MDKTLRDETKPKKTISHFESIQAEIEAHEKSISEMLDKLTGLMDHISKLQCKCGKCNDPMDIKKR